MSEISRTEKLATIAAARQLFEDMMQENLPPAAIQEYRNNIAWLTGRAKPAEQPTVEEEAAFDQFLAGVRAKHATRN
jgi:hypothetical protein